MQGILHDEQNGTQTPLICLVPTQHQEGATKTWEITATLQQDLKLPEKTSLQVKKTVWLKIISITNISSKVMKMNSLHKSKSYHWKTA